MQRWTAALIFWRLTWLLGTKLKESWWRWVSVADTCSSALRIVKSCQTQGIVAGVSKTWEWAICSLPGSLLDTSSPAPLRKCSREKWQRESGIWISPTWHRFSKRCCRTLQTWTWCSSRDLEKKSEFHLNTQKQRCSNSTSFTSTWNTVGTLVRPNGMIKYSKCPMGYSVSVIMGNQGSEGCLERQVSGRFNCLDNLMSIVFCSAPVDKHVKRMSKLVKNWMKLQVTNRV